MNKRRTVIVLFALVAILFALPIVQQLYSRNDNVDLFAEDRKKYASLGGNFVANSTDGEVQLSQFLEQGIVVLYFGFTRCPDICPTTLANLGAALKLVSKHDREHIIPAMLSVDPEHDSVESVVQYADFFIPGMIGLHGGSWQNTQQIAHAYGAYFDKVPLPESALGYTVDHTTRLYVIDHDGIATLLEHNQNPQSIADTLTTVLSNS